jgi:2-haloacid dehalogenase
MQASDVRALTFDVFGTVVDWRGTVSREIRLLCEAKGIKLDALRFADQWRAGYGPSMDLVRKGVLVWTKLDDLHMMILERLLDEFSLARLEDEEKLQLNNVWHRLDPWPDAVAGLARLRRRYTVATLSNGNVSLLTDMAKHAGLPWDCILSSELAGHYKPDPEVYLKAADLLSLRPQQVMMVAAHVGDLAAARSVGFRSALVVRPLEFGEGSAKADTDDPEADIVARDFVELAAKLGAPG